MEREVSFWRTKRRPDGTLYWESVDRYDIEEAVKRLKPEDRGYRYAAANDPHPGQHLTADEKEMLSEANDKVTELRGWHSRAVGEITNDLNSLALAPSADALFGNVSSEFESRSDKLKAAFETDIEALESRLKSSTKNLNIFREQNGITTREAYYPESYVFHFALVFAAVVVEGILNAAFFPQTLGLLGGFFIAVMVSVANVAVCFVGGWLFLREINHVKRHRKILGALGFVLVLILIFGLHVSVAHYREAVARHPEADFLAALSFDPRTLEDMESLLLIGFGAAISIFAFWKGYRADDPYPGYLRIFLGWEALRKQTSEAVKEYRLSVLSALHDAETQLLAYPSTVAEAEGKLRAFQGDAEAYLSCCESYYAQARQGALALITAFRRAVQRIWEDTKSFPVGEELVSEAVIELDPRSLWGAVETDFGRRFKEMEKSLNEYRRDKQAKLEDLRKKGDRLVRGADVKFNDDAR